MTGIPEDVPTFLRFRHLVRLLQIDPRDERQVRHLRGLLERKTIPSRQPAPRADRLIYPGELQEWADGAGFRLDWEGLMEDEMK